MNILTIKKNIHILYIKMDNIAWLFFTNSNITKNFNEKGVKNYEEKYSDSNDLFVVTNNGDMGSCRKY